MKSAPICREEHRREDVRASRLNGLDYLEVGADQLTLDVYFLGKAPKHIRAANVRIDAPRGGRTVSVKKIEVHRHRNPELDDRLEVTVDRPGDFSRYTLRLVNDPRNPRDSLVASFDPRYSELDFSFKTACPSELDCKIETACPPAVRPEPEISYLAKDYASFRQQIFDRLALIMPDWRERHVPDLGVALVELLAYTGDHLSYYQDAVATEAYLGTARERISVRRHARLVDYEMHEGCNARAWVWLDSAGDIDPPLDANDLFFIAPRKAELLPDGKVLSRLDLDRVPSSAYEVFEPVKKTPIKVYAAHSRISFYTWGNRECCLPRGTTRATLKDGKPMPPPAPPAIEPAYEQQDKYPSARSDKGAYEDKETCEEPVLPAEPVRELRLQPGDVLIFEEVIGPKTGQEADADPAHRHAVRLTKVEPGQDELYGQPVLEVEWAEADALPFPLCLSVMGPPDKCEFLQDVSVAHGNVVLADHGRTISGEELGQVEVESTAMTCQCEGRPSEVTLTPAKFDPSLKKSPVTFSERLRKDAPASRTLMQNPRRALPQIALSSEPGGAGWFPRRHLLASDGDERCFVAEIDNEGIAHLRFGDGDCGRIPEAQTSFQARYRVGNGVAGNVGPESISRIVFDKTKLDSLGVCNPMAASGGTAAEPIAEVKLFAPRAFKKELRRAITAEDYAAIVMRDFPETVQRAGAELRWTGSWHEVRVAIDPRGTAEAPPELLREIERHLRAYRRIGHEVRAVPARYVPLSIALTICVLPRFLRGHVEFALRDVFAAGPRANGQPGFFHPDKLTFGDGIYLSRLVAAAQAIEGVESVQVTMLQRLFEAPNYEIPNGVLPLGALEIAQLDNDLRAPDRGQLKLNLEGGR